MFCAHLGPVYHSSFKNCSRPVRYFVFASPSPHFTTSHMFVFLSLHLCIYSSHNVNTCLQITVIHGLMVSQDYCFISLMVPWTNELTPLHTHALANEAFSQLFPPFIVVILYFMALLFFPTCLSSARLQHLFATVPILWGHHFTCVYFSFSPFPFVKAHSVRVPPLFSSPSLAASQFRNYSSGLKQWW